MSQKSQEQPSSGHPDDLLPEGGDVAQEQSLEKIREILFGEKTRVHEERLARFEETLLRELGAVRGDLQRRVEALEARLKKDYGELERRLLESEREGILGREQLARDIDSGRRHLEERMGELGERSDKNVEFVQERLADESKALREAITRRSDELAQAVERALAEVKTEKVDRSVMAAMIAEVAARLADSAKKLRND